MLSAITSPGKPFVHRATRHQNEDEMDGSRKLIAGLRSELYSPGVDTNTCSPASLSMAYQWMAACLRTHVLCHQFQQKYIPRRLINISKPRRPRLVHRTENSHRYVTLSYKRGTESMYVTNKANKRNHYNSIPYLQLPRTIQDAIHVTYELGFRYLWIDSLCLVQDDKKDLDCEIDRMGDIYRSSTLTIFAEAADGATQGLKSFRDVRLSKPSRVRVRALLDGEVFDASACLSMWVPAGYVPPSPIARRGWILQEQELSVRKLSFGHHRIRWLCQQGQHSDLDPGDQGVSGGSLMAGQHWLTESRPHYRRADNHIKDDLYVHWYTLIENYARRSLSKTSDILRALAGLAKTFADNHQTHYVNGLWREDMEMGLLWKVVLSGKTEAERQAERQANRQEVDLALPSWSWASKWGNSISFEKWHIDTCRLLFEVDGSNNCMSMALRRIWNKRGDGISSSSAMDPQLWSSGDRYQEGKMHRLRLSGPLISAIVQNGEPNYDDYNYLQVDHPAGLYMKWIRSVLKPESGRVIGYIELDNDPGYEPVKEITCMLCCVRKTLRGDSFYTYLALKKTEQSRAEYVRVGLVQAIAEASWFEPIPHREIFCDESRGDKPWVRTTIFLR